MYRRKPMTHTEIRVAEERLPPAARARAVKSRARPEQLMAALIPPVLFLLMFTYLFGGAVAGGTDAYLQYILPGVLAQSVVFVSVYSGVALNTDVTKGVTDRFRSLPIWRPAQLFGAVLGDSIRYVIAGTLVIVLGLILGFDADGGVIGLIAALAVVVAFTFGLSWAFTT